MGVVHRDIKLENVMVVNTDQPEPTLKIADFGLSKLIEPCAKAHDQVGTLLYVAPEVIKGEGYTKAVDVWSAGVLFYAVCTGLMPFYDKPEEPIVD